MAAEGAFDRVSVARAVPSAGSRSYESPGARPGRPRAVPGLAPSRVPVPEDGLGGRYFPAGGAVRVRRRVRPSSVPAGGPAAAGRPSAVTARLVGEALRGSGQPLAEPLQQEMRARLGADFSRVRVHTGTAARASAVALGARAYTVGGHIVFGDGGTDRHTLAHELTHVIQQSRGPVAGTDGGGLRVSDPFDVDERAAEATAARAMRGTLPQPGPGAEAVPGPGTATTGTGTVPVQREIENATYNTKDKAAKRAADEFFEEVNTKTKKAYNYVVTVPSLGGAAELDGHTKRWRKLWKSYLKGERPKLMAASFGYAIETLVSKENSHLVVKPAAGYSIVPQVTQGGTRPDLVLRLVKGSNSIAWADLTASGSVDHIFDKENWTSHVSIFAEITYPSLTVGTLAFMRANKDQKGDVSAKELAERMKAAKLEHRNRQQQWKALGKSVGKPIQAKVTEKTGLSKNLWTLGGNPDRVREAVAESLQEVFKTEEEPSLGMVASILLALGVSRTTFLFDTGFNQSLAAGEAWLIDNEPEPETKPEEEAEPAEMEVAAEPEAMDIVKQDE